MITGTAPPQRFRLGREVLFAYVAPALCAGAGGLATGQRDLVIAALTSIALTSALFAAVIGVWLQRSAFRYRWPVGIPRLALAAGAAVSAAVLGELIAWCVTQPWAPLPERVRIDFPLAAALAAIITTWRWRAVQNRRDIS